MDTTMRTQLLADALRGGRRAPRQVRPAMSTALMVPPTGLDGPRVFVQSLPVWLAERQAREAMALARATTPDDALREATREAANDPASDTSFPPPDSPTSADQSAGDIAVAAEGASASEAAQFEREPEQTSAGIGAMNHPNGTEG
jgi:hypothetical protein